MNSLLGSVFLILSVSQLNTETEGRTLVSRDTAVASKSIETNGIFNEFGYVMGRYKSDKQSDNEHFEWGNMNSPWAQEHLEPLVLKNWPAEGQQGEFVMMDGRFFQVQRKLKDPVEYDYIYVDNCTKEESEPLCFGDDEGLLLPLPCSEHMISGLKTRTAPSSHSIVSDKSEFHATDFKLKKTCIKVEATSTSHYKGKWVAASYDQIKKITSCAVDDRDKMCKTFDSPSMCKKVLINKKGTNRACSDNAQADIKSWCHK
eukprot:Awhi_evm1s4450